MINFHRLAIRHYSQIKRKSLIQDQTQHLAEISAWYINSSKATTKFAGVDLEQLFIDTRVQTILKVLTGFDLNKIHRWRISNISNRRHYALMTENMYKEFVSRLGKRAEYFLQPVPFKEPKLNQAETLAYNPEINVHDTFKMIFTDISYDATKNDRTVVIREPNGILRTALPEEHYRMHRTYYEQPERPVKEPRIFSLGVKDGRIVPGKELERSLSRNEHENILDWACYFYEPDDPKFVELCKCIFDNTIHQGQMDILYSTRHFSTLIFYMLINGYIVELLNYYAQKRSIMGAANTIRLYQIIFPDWKTDIPSDASDHTIIKEFLALFEVQHEEEQPSLQAQDSIGGRDDVKAKNLQHLRNLILEDSEKTTP